MTWGSEWFAAFVAAALIGCAGQTPPPETPPPQEEGPEVTVSLRLLDGGEDEETGTPRNHAELALIHPDGRRDVRPIGQLVGVCTHEEVPGAVLGVRCWWAGAGATVTVRRDGDRLHVMSRPVDEETGEGQEEELMAVDLPAGATLHAIRAH